VGLISIQYLIIAVGDQDEELPSERLVMKLIRFMAGMVLAGNAGDRATDAFAMTVGTKVATGTGVTTGRT